MVQNISSVIAGVLIAIITNWRLALIILAVIPLVGLQGYLQMKFLKGFSADAKVASCAFTSSSNAVTKNLLKLNSCTKSM